MRIRLAHIFLGGLILASCQVNELPEDEFSEAAFYMNGSMDGEEFDLSAGPDGIVVNPESSLIIDELPEFSTEFASFGCDTCLENFTLNITGAEIYSPEALLSDLLSLDLYQVISLNPQEANNANFTVNSTDSPQGNLNIVNYETNEPLELLNQSNFYADEGNHRLEWEYIPVNFGAGYCSYHSDFYVNEFQEICHEPAIISFLNNTLTLQLSEGFGMRNVSINNNGVMLPLLFGSELTIDLTNYVQKDSPSFSLSIESVNPSECTHFENYIWVIYPSNPEGLCVPVFDFEEFNSPDLVYPQSVSLSYTNPSGVEFFSTFDEGSDWFSVDQIEESNINNVYIASISCNVKLQSTDEPNEIIFFESSDSSIPLHFE